MFACLGSPVMTVSKREPAETVFRYEELKSLIEHNQIKKIEDLIPLLPAPLRRKFVLLYKSRSIQSGSNLNPRVILYGDDAKLIITFNGSPEQRGFNKLEIMQFRDDSFKFDFKEIDFSEAELGNVVFNEKPTSCVKCHGENGKPIWDSYASWPGAYGSVDDNLIKDSTEKTNFLRFRELAKQHPRYKNLEVLAPKAKEKFLSPNGSQFVRWADWLPPEGKTHQMAPYRGQINEPRSLDRPYYFRPNLLFGMTLDELMARRLYQLMLDAGSYSRNPFTLLYLSSSCDVNLFSAKERLPEFPVDHEQISRIVSYQSEMKAVRADAPEGSYPGIKLYEKIISGNAFESASPQLMGDIFRMASVSSVPLFEWTSGLEKNNFFVSVTLPTYIYYLGQDLKFSLKSNENCGQLKSKALQELKSTDFTGFKYEMLSPKANRSAQHLLNNCMQCHSKSENIGPVIAFDRPDILKSQLNQPYSTHGTLKDDISYRLTTKSSDRMPLNEFLTEKEKKDLLDYIEALSKEP